MGVNKTDCGNRFIITVKCYVTTKSVRPNHVNHTQLRVCVCVCAQLCTTLCDSMDCSPPGSSVHGILQARTLEWVASSFSNAWKWKVKVKSLSHVQLFVTPWTVAHQAPPSMGFSRQEYWSGLPLPSSLGMVNNHWMEICFDNNVQAPLSLDLHTGKLSQFIKL